MKTIELKKLGELDYKVIIGNIIRSAEVGKGMAIDEMRKAVKILDTLEKADKELVLEDSEFNYLKNRVTTFKFAMAHKDILEFVDDIVKGAK